VHLACFSDEAVDERHIAALREFCEDVFCLPLGRMRKIARGLGGLAGGRSISEAAFADRRMKTWIGHTLERSDIEGIFTFCSAMAPYLPGHLARGTTAIDMVDVDSEKWRAYSRSAREPFRTLYRIEQQRVLELEKRAAAMFDHVFFVSQNEAEAFLELDPGAWGKVRVLENGVDLDRFDPSRPYENPFEAGRLPIVFTGAMDYRANIDAVAWFASDAFPEIRRDHRAAEFWIVGGNPASSVRKLQRNPGVFATGVVPDVRPYLAHASCVVAPMRIARGVQNKVLEAMAMAKPVVVTQAALEGLRARPGCELLLAKDAGEFVARVTQVLAEYPQQMGAAARAFVEREHRWAQKLCALDGVFPRARGPLQGAEICSEFTRARP
jgi:sugar transferase (PEP-CTERM/EpsH1 system associated)